MNALEGTLRTADGVTLRSRRWPAPDAEAVVVLVHGFSATAEDRGVVSQAEALVAGGFEVLSFDGRGHGTSEGHCTLGDLEELDVAAAAEAAAADGRPVIVVGASMGAVAALRHAAAGTGGPDGVVAVSVPSVWQAPFSPQGLAAVAMTRTRAGRRLAEWRIGVRVASRWTDPEAPVDFASRITCPVALVHGTADRFIPPANSVRLHRRLRCLSRIDLVPGMGHGFGRLATAPVVAAAQWTLAAARRQAPAA